MNEILQNYGPELIERYNLVLRLLLAAALGGMIGLEREASGKPAGFRTNSGAGTSTIHIQGKDELAPFDHAIAYVPELNLYLDGTAEFSGSRDLPATRATTHWCGGVSAGP